MSAGYYPGNGSALFESNWAGKCHMEDCETRWKAGDMIGYLEGEDKPVCEDCHTTLSTYDDSWDY
jgi:hypothetical protein